MLDENGIDQYNPYAVPRPDDLYKRCEHNLIADECGTCEDWRNNHCACGNESPYNPRCDQCEALCRQFDEERTANL